jgi:hypothetical protein
MFITRILTRSIESRYSCFPSPPLNISFPCTWHSSRFSPSPTVLSVFFSCLFSVITVLTLGNSALFRFVPFSAHFHAFNARSKGRPVDPCFAFLPPSSSPNSRRSPLLHTVLNNRRWIHQTSAKSINRYSPFAGVCHVPSRSSSDKSSARKYSGHQDRGLPDRRS